MGIMKSEYKTKTRNSIIEYLKAHSDMRFTARDIFDALSKEDATLNRSTIYRNLERLCSEGKLIRYKEANCNATCYQFSSCHEHCHSHMHAQCSDCGKIFHLDNSFVHDFESQIHDTYGIDVDLGKTVIIGQCENCKKRH